MSSGRHVLLGSIISVTIVSGASAGSDPFAPFAHCRTVIGERDYRTSGGKLIETKQADLANFPKGLLGVNCQGGMLFEGIVQEDGSVLLSGSDRAITCDGELNTGGLKRLDKSIWRGTVIGQRFQTLHYEPLRTVGASVCVRIRRDWVPETPHRFWSQEEWDEAHPK